MRISDVQRAALVAAMEKWNELKPDEAGGPIDDQMIETQVYGVIADANTEALIYHTLNCHADEGMDLYDLEVARDQLIAACAAARPVVELQLAAQHEDGMHNPKWPRPECPTCQSQSPYREKLEEKRNAANKTTHSTRA